MSSVDSKPPLVSTSRAGLAPALSGVSTEYLDALAGWTVPAGGGGGGGAIAQWGVPSGIAGTGSVGANGALTLGTALAQGAIYGQGIWLYFPAGACYSGSLAGSYWCVMSSATLGTIYDIKLGAAIPYIPAAPPAIVDAGPGAYTGATIEITLATIAIPANTFLSNDFFSLMFSASYNNAAINKTFRARANTSLLWLNVASTTKTLLGLLNFSICGTRLLGHPNSSYGPTITTTLFNTATVDVASIITIEISCGLATGTENVLLEGGSLQ